MRVAQLLINIELFQNLKEYKMLAFVYFFVDFSIGLVYLISSVLQAPDGCFNSPSGYEINSKRSFYGRR